MMDCWATHPLLTAIQIIFIAKPSLEWLVEAIVMRSTAENI